MTTLFRFQQLQCAVMATSMALILTCSALAADWPQWRGPARSGVSQETGLMKEWPDSGPQLVWQINDLGYGYGAPAVADGRLYVTANEGLEDEMVRALDADTGKITWSTRIGNVGNPKQRPNFPAARSTPTVDGDVLFALGSDGDLACLETATGKIRWTRNIRHDFGGKPGPWAYAESPLVDGTVVVCTPGGPDAALVALDKSSGEEIWKSAIPDSEAAGYASVVIAQAGDVKQYVAYLGLGLVGVDAKTGNLLWQYTTTKGIANMPTPVAHDGLVYSGTTRTGGGLVELKAASDGVSAQQVYFSPKLPSAIGGAVLVGDYLYGCGGKTLQCVEFKSGEIKWEDRSAAPGSLCYADGNLYLHGENGEVVLVEATPDGYHQRGRFTPPDAPSRPTGWRRRGPIR